MIYIKKTILFVILFLVGIKVISTTVQASVNIHHCKDDDDKCYRVPSPTPTIRVCNEDYTHDQGNCVEPTITPITPTPTTQEASPSATPTNTPKNPCEGVGNDSNGHPCGWSPDLTTQVNNSTPVCTASLPSKPSFTFTRKSPTEVDITWLSDGTNVTGWSLSWGYDANNLPYGNGEKLDKNAREFLIGGLEPNANTWVELTAWNGNDCAVYSDRIDP